MKNKKIAYSVLCYLIEVEIVRKAMDKLEFLPEQDNLLGIANKKTSPPRK